MKKNLIRITELQLHQVIKESVNSVLKKLLKEGAVFPNYRQTINMTNIYDDDEMNSAAVAEEHDETEHAIIRAISTELCNGGSPSKVPFEFKNLIRIVERFGFQYEGNDDEKEEIIFSNQKGENLIVWPRTYYSNMDSMRIKNLGIF